MKAVTLQCNYRVNPLGIDDLTPRLCDENGQIEDAESAWFETGLMESSDWTGKRIAGVDTDRKERLSADCFQKRFALRGFFNSPADARFSVPLLSHFPSLTGRGHES